MFNENYGYNVADCTHDTRTPVTKGTYEASVTKTFWTVQNKTTLHTAAYSFSWVPQWFGTSTEGLSAEGRDHSLTICLPTFHVILFAHIQ